MIIREEREIMKQYMMIKESENVPSKTQIPESDKPPCDCGNQDAYWKGDPHGLRTYACAVCHGDDSGLDTAVSLVDEAIGDGEDNVLQNMINQLNIILYNVETALENFTGGSPFKSIIDQAEKLKDNESPDSNDIEVLVQKIIEVDKSSEGLLVTDKEKWNEFYNKVQTSVIIFIEKMINIYEAKKSVSDALRAATTADEELLEQDFEEAHKILEMCAAAASRGAAAARRAALPIAAEQ